MTKNPLHQLMVQNTRLITSANSVLTQLWLLFLFETNPSAPVWDMMLLNYIEKAKTVVDPKIAENWKSNLPKDLAREQLSWNAFCQGLEVLDYHTCKIYIELEKGDKAEEFIIDLEVKYGEYDYSLYLSSVLAQINDAFPELHENFEALWDMYCKKLERVNVKLPPYVKHNLISALERSGKITWNSFYRGLVVYDFDMVRISIEFVTQSKERRVTTLEVS